MQVEEVHGHGESLFLSARRPDARKPRWRARLAGV